MVDLRTLDECSFTIGASTIAPDSELVFAFLLFLAMERGRRIPRAQVAELFWPGARDESARHCLRQTVYKLRQLGVPVESTPSHVSLPAAAVTRDFDALFTPAAYRVDETGAATVVGDFLPGYLPRVSDAFREWLEQQRIHVQTGVRRALLTALGDRRGRGRWLEVEALARRCLQLDPLNEEATLALAEAAAMSGAKARAIEILDEYLAELGDEARDIRLPASILRKRIAERLPSPRYATTESCFVGRADSMAFLSERLKATRIGQGGGCLVWGDAGIGKTRLTYEFGRMATLQGALVQRVKCQASDPGRPLSIWVDIVPELLNLPGALGCSPRSLGYLKRLTEHDVTALEPSEETREAEFLYASVRQALFDLVDAVASEAPLVIVVEDVHWLDRMSWQVLREMIEWAHERRLLFVLTSRTFGITPEGRTEPVRGFDRHRLTSLAEEEATELLRAVLREHRATLSDRLRGWCLSIGDGNPLYLRELAAYWLATEDTTRVPPTLEALIDERVARLGPDELRALQACALLGVNSTLERIEALLERKAHELLATLEELERYGLTHAVDSRVLVHHDLIGAAALERASESALKLMHRRAGLLLEQEIERTQNASLLWDCARHWATAGEQGRSLELARRCGEHLLHVGLPLEAAGIFERSLTLCQTSRERAEIRSVLVTAFKQGGRWSRVRTLCDEILNESKDTNPSNSHHDDIELERLESGWMLNESQPDLLMSAGKCVMAASAEPRHRVRAGILALILADNLGDADRASQIFRALEPLLTFPGISPEERLLANLVYHTHNGDLSTAERAADRWREGLSQPALNASYARAVRFCAATYRAAGRTDAMRQALLESFTVSKQLGAVDGMFASSERLALAASDEGDHVTAEEWYRIGRACLMEPSTYMGADHSAYLGARIAILAGDLTTAIARARSFPWENLLSDPIPRRRAARTAVWLHLAEVAALDMSITLELFDQLARDFERFKTRGSQDLTAHALYVVMRCTKGRAKAREHLQTYVSCYRRERLELPVYIRNALTEASASSP